MLCRRRRGRGLWRHLRAAGRLAIDDVVPLADRNAARRGDGVVDRDEAQRAGRAGLQVDVGNARAALHLIADAQRLDELQFAAGPHPARQRHRRQETAAGRMAVLAQLRHRKHRRRQAPMRGERRGVARLRLADLLEQRRAQTLHKLRGDDVGGFLGAADPLPQVIDVGLFARDGRSTHDDFLTGCALGKFMVLADAGHRTVAAPLADKDRRRRRVAHLAVRRVNLDAAQMRMLGEIVHRVHFGERNVGVRQLRSGVRRGSICQSCRRPSCL